MHDFSIGSGMDHVCSPEGDDYFLIFHPSGKAGGSQVRRRQGIAVKCYGLALGALTLIPSGFCNVGVICAF